MLPHQGSEGWQHHGCRPRPSVEAVYAGCSHSRKPCRLMHAVDPAHTPSRTPRLASSCTLGTPHTQQQQQNTESRAGRGAHPASIAGGTERQGGVPAVHHPGPEDVGQLQDLCPLLPRGGLHLEQEQLALCAQHARQQAGLSPWFLVFKVVNLLAGL